MRKRRLWKSLAISFILIGASSLLPAQRPGRNPGALPAQLPGGETLHPPEIDSTSRIVAIYAIQVGAFSVMRNAEKLSGELRAKGFDALIYDNLIDGKNLLHLVWVGRFNTIEEAMPVMEKIERQTGIRGVLREQMIWRREGNGSRAH